VTTFAIEGNGKTTKQALVSKRRLSLACGKHKPAGFHGIDYAPDSDADTVIDLLPSPWQSWPIKTSSAREIECNHFVEHIPHWRPGWEKDGWWLFFDELYRICANDAIIKIVHPYCQSSRAFWDPTHERFIHEATWLYLNPEWRQQEALDHYPTQVNFEVITIDGSWQKEEFSARAEQQAAFAREHYWNVIADIAVTLRCHK
jgi:hypothetical protein